MGLNMYAFKTRTPVGAVDFEKPKDKERIAYWRKHPNLHGWMEQLYYAKGGAKDSFNCTGLRLDATDLDALEVAVNGNALPDTTGLFFGESGPDRVGEDRAFIEKARAALQDGNFVYYDSWW
jgi:hypothetical protein